MKKRIAWITDSTSGLTPSEAERLDIHVLPLSVIFEQKAYKEGINITNEEFYEKLNNTTELPTSSQPTVGESVAFYEDLKTKYDIGIAVHVSSKLSGTYNNSIAAAEMAGFPLIGIDSKTGANPLISMIQEGRNQESLGRSISEIEAHLKEMADNARACILIGSLEQVAKGGRVSNTQLLIGNLLKINLIIKLEDGNLIPSEKVRTTTKATKKVLQNFTDTYNSNQDIHNISVVHTTTPEEAERWAIHLHNECRIDTPSISTLSPVIGVHGGAGTIGLFWFEK